MYYNTIHRGFWGGASQETTLLINAFCIQVSNNNKYYIKLRWGCIMKRIIVTILVVMVTLCFACISFAIDQNDEIVSMRTKYAKTYDNRDGSFTTKVYLIPIHQIDELGN